MFGVASLIQLDPIFVDEARYNLDQVELALLSVGTPDEKPELVDSIYRCVHSVKGGSASFGLSQLAELMHVSESVLDRWRQERLAPDAVCIGLLLDAIAVARRQLAGDDLSDASATELAQRLRVRGKPVEHEMPARLVYIVVEQPHRRDLQSVVTWSTCRAMAMSERSSRFAATPRKASCWIYWQCTSTATGFLFVSTWMA